MNIPINTIMLVIQTLVGALIIQGKADVILLGWYFFISGSVSLFALILLVILESNKHNKENE